MGALNNYNIMVNSMKHTSLTVAILFFLASPVSVLAEEHMVLENSSETVVFETGASTPANPATSHQMHDMGMMRKGKGQQGKGHSGMKHGGGQQGKGHGGMKHGGGQHGKGMHEKHEQVVRRLDMIEARMAKIEAMLEILMRR